jgi:tetratricopeptide (TPR) repeat protein
MTRRALRAPSARARRARLVAVLIAAAAAAAAAPGAAQDAPTKIEVQRQLAASLARAGNHRRAVEEYRKLLAGTPGDVEAVRGISRSLALLGETAEAIRFLAPLAADASRREFGDRLTLAGLYVKANRKSEALAVLAGVGTKPAAREEEVLDVATLWLDAGAAARARATLANLPARALESGRGLELTADVTAAMGEHARAAAHYLKLAGPGRANLAAAWRYAEELDLSGEKARAFAEVKRLLPRGGATAAQLVFAAHLALDEKDVDLAERVVERIPATDLSHDVELVRAEVKIARGDYTAAEAVLERALARHGASARLRRTFVPVLLELGSFSRARALLAPLLAAQASLDDLRVAARIHRALGDARAAERACRELVRRRPARVDQALDLADFLVEQHQGDLAIRLLDAVPARGEERLVAHVIRASALLDGFAGDPEVLDALRPVLRRPALAPDLAVRLADLLVDMGADRLALRALDAAVAARTLAAAADHPEAASLHALRHQAGLGASGEPPPELPFRWHSLRARAVFRSTGDRDRALQHAAAEVGRLPEGMPIAAVVELAGILLELAAPEMALRVLDFAPPPPIRQFAVDLLRARILYLGMARVGEAERLIRALVASRSPDLTLDLDLVALLLEVHEIDLARRFLDALWVTPEHAFRHGLLRATVSMRSREGRRAAASRLAALEAPTPLRDPADAAGLAEAYLELPDRPRALRILMSIDPPGRLAFRHQVLMAQGFMKQNLFRAVEEILGGVRDDLVRSPANKAAAIELALGLKELPAAELMFEQLPAWWLDTHEGRRLAVNMDIARRRMDRALPVARRLVRDRPSDPNELNLQGQAHIGVAQHCEALAIFDDLLKLVPEKDEWVLGRAQALRGLERRPEALRPHMDLVARYDAAGEPPPIDFILEAAEVNDESHHAKTALSLYRRALAIRPGDPDVMKAMAGTLGRLDRPQEAMIMFRRAAATKPEKSDAVALAGYMREVGSRAHARSMLERAVARDPRDLAARRALAGILAERDDTRREAIPLYREILALRPDDHQTRALLASALARLGEHDRADWELEHLHVKRPRDREARRVRSTLDVVHGYPNISERHLTALKYQERTDPATELGLADVAASRGRGYLRDEVTHVLEAKAIAPRRTAVTQRMEQVFLPLLAADVLSESGSDTLERTHATAEWTRLARPDGEIALRGVARQIRRRGVVVSGADADGRYLWNFRPGATATVALIAGELGDGDPDFLPRLELRYTGLLGGFAGIDLHRLRIDDSPEALLAGLRSNTLQLLAGRDFGAVRTELSARIDDVTDGNRRRTLIGLARWRPWPRLSLDLEVQSRASDFVPVPFDLYFAPLSYLLVNLSLEYTTTLHGPFEVVAGAGVLTDRLDEDVGNGARARVRVNRRMGRLAQAFASLELLTTSATRRLGSDPTNDRTSFTLTTAQVGYATRF